MASILKKNEYKTNVVASLGGVLVEMIFAIFQKKGTWVEMRGVLANHTPA